MKSIISEKDWVITAVAAIAPWEGTNIKSEGF